MNIELIPPAVKSGFRKIVSPVVAIFVRYQLNPNWLTTISFFVSVAAAIQFGRGALRGGALLTLLGGLFDMIDGAVARASQRVTRFGALYDSTLDRYAEILTLMGIGYFFFNSNGRGLESGLFVSMVVLAALSGSLMVSYVRARAEALNFECKVGIVQRPERVVLIGVGALISPSGLVWAMIAIAFFANMTAIQRIINVWLMSRSEKWDKLPSDVPHE